MSDILCQHDKALLGSTWGASSVYHAGFYYLFISVIGNCSMGNWFPQSAIYIATSKNADGPFCNASKLVPSFSHNPSVAYDAKRKQYVMAYIGNPLRKRRCHEGDIGSELSWWAKVLVWLGIWDDDTSVTHINVAKHPKGPWKPVYTGHFMAKSWTWRTWTSNPSLYVHPNGTHYMAYKGKDSTLYTRPKIGIAWAPSAEGPWNDYTTGPVLQQHVEDPHLYFSNNRPHLLLHAYRVDSRFAVWKWNESKTEPMALRWPWYARQRPSWLKNEKGHPVALMNAVIRTKGGRGSTKTFTLRE